MTHGESRLEKFLLQQSANVLLLGTQPNQEYIWKNSLSWPFPGDPAKPVPECLHSGFHLVLRMMEVLVTTGVIRCAKLQLKCHQQQTNTQFFSGRMPFLSPNQQCQSTEGKTCWLDENQKGYWHQRADERHGKPRDMDLISVLSLSHSIVSRL